MRLNIRYTLLYIQDDNEELQPLFDKLHKVKEFCSKHKHHHHHHHQFSVAALLASLDTTTFASYTGSFTTPPCTEEVQWVSFLRPLTVSGSQLDQLRWGQGHTWHSVHTLLCSRSLENKYGNPVQDNFRPTQPLDGRTVTIYGNL